MFHELPRHPGDIGFANLEIGSVRPEARPAKPAEGTSGLANRHHSTRNVWIQLPTAAESPAAPDFGQVFTHVFLHLLSLAAYDPMVKRQLSPLPGLLPPHGVVQPLPRHQLLVIPRLHDPYPLQYVDRAPGRGVGSCRRAGTAPTLVRSVPSRCAQPSSGPRIAPAGH